MIIWVVLSNTHVRLTVNTLRTELNATFPGEFLPPRPAGTFVVAGSTAAEFMIASAIKDVEGVFLLHSVNAPYRQFSDFARWIPDPERQKNAAAQRCWLGMTVLDAWKSEDTARRFMGRTLARLAPPDAAYLVDADRGGITLPFDAETRGRLAEGSPFSARQ